jgi:hypothetical protein
LEAIGDHNSPYSQKLSSCLNNLPMCSVLTYFARPANPNGNAIIIFGDIFGRVYDNVQLVADAFAASGYVTVVPDLFDGDAFSPINYEPEEIDWPVWLARHSDTDIDSIVDAVVDHLKNILGVKKLAGVGYCFGAKVSVLFPRYLTLTKAMTEQMLVHSLVCRPKHEEGQMLRRWLYSAPITGDNRSTPSYHQASVNRRSR